MEMFRTSAWRGISLIFLVTGLVSAQQEIIFSESTVFQLFIEEGDFDNALRKCEDLNEGNNRFEFSLARIDSQAVFEFIVNEFELETLELNSTRVDKIDRQSIWIGLRRNPFSKVFEFVDGVNADNSFFSSDNEFPWDGTQPNGGVTQSNDDGADTESVQDCVSWERLALADGRSDLTWYDDDCGATMSAFLCRGEVLPTPAPTREPTTPNPTEAPSNLTSTIFLSVAGVSGLLMLLSLVILVRKKRDLKSVQQALHDKEKLSELALTDEKEGAMY